MVLTLYCSLLCFKIAYLLCVSIMKIYTILIIVNLWKVSTCVFIWLSDSLIISEQLFYMCRRSVLYSGKLQTWSKKLLKLSLESLKCLCTAFPLASKIYILLPEIPFLWRFGLSWLDSCWDKHNCSHGQSLLTYLCFVLKFWRWALCNPPEEGF